MLKKVITLTLLLQMAAAFGQTTVTLHLPASGDFAVFSSHGLPTEQPASPTASKGGAAALVVPAGDDTVTIWDKTTGNLGSKPLAKVKDGWTAAETDLDHIAQISVAAVHDGSPIAAGEVSLDDGTKREPEILDPKSAGVATFFDIKPGRVFGTVKVKSDKGGSDQITQVIQCPLTRDQLVPHFTIAVAQQVDTVGGAGTATPGAPASSSGKQASAENPPNVVGQILTYLVALGVAAAVIYGVLTYFKKSPGTVAQKLEQLGVQIPKPDDENPAVGPIAPIDLPKPEPPQKILLDDAAPTPLNNLSPGPSIGVSAVAVEPSLVNSAGITLPLMEGETIVGRDAGLGLSLTGESTVSRKHATLQRRGGEVTLVDHGSTNGTFVNGARIQAPAVLRPGDSVQFGSVAFRYQG